MQWLQWIVNNPIVALVGLAASVVTLYPVGRWLLGFRIVRAGAKRQCPYCNGNGKLYSGYEMGNIKVGDYHPCRICHGTGRIEA